MALKRIELKVPSVHKDVLELQDIENAVKKITKVNPRTKSRQRAYVNARMLFYFLASSYTTVTLTAISRFSQTHHANVIYHLKNVPYLIAQDPEIKEWYFYIIDFLNELINLRIKNKDENVYTKNVLEKVEFLLEENKRINNTLAKLIEVNEPEEI